MTRHVENSGIANFGRGKMKINGPTAVGTGAIVNIHSAQTPSPAGQGASIGVVTVISEEADAVRYSLGLEPTEVGHLGFDVGTLQVRGEPVTVAATRALTQGQESAMAAYNHLREHFDPAIVILTGIAGAIHTDARLGDVVVATRVVCYDLRKETPSATRYRGQEREAPAVVGHAVNAFFTDNGEPAELSIEEPGNTKGTVRVLNGPIGSGNAVIADRDSGILKFLARFNDKILAVDMESAGLSQAHHEGLTASGRPLGWLVVRGISDDASKQKNDDYHRLASRNAAIVLRELLPYLPTAPSGSRAG